MITLDHQFLKDTADMSNEQLGAYVRNLLQNSNNDIPTRQLNFINEVAAVTRDLTYPETMKMEFCVYWTEHSPKGKKMRFEMQKVFDIRRRLVTWSKNAKTNYGRKELSTGTIKSAAEEII